MPKAYDEQQLKKTLNQDQFAVTRRKETEQPFQNLYWNNFETGIYKCIVCSAPLFSSQHKFEDGFGWPAFYDVMPEAKIKKVEDHALDYVRTQASCERCGSHLGYIFNDGPKEHTGKRYIHKYQKKILCKFGQSKVFTKMTLG